MKVFASWSGELSHKVAGLLKTWLEDVLQDCEVWLSSEDIEKGAVWFTEVSETLKATSFGILCVTRENVTAPWLLFEAGALSKGLTKSRVSPLLIDFTPKELDPPLLLLNATVPNREEMLKLVKSINNNSGDPALITARLSEERLERAFTRCWPEFEKEFAALLKGASGTKPAVRDQREILEEVAELTKSVYKTIQERANQDAVENAVLKHKLQEFEIRCAQLEEQKKRKALDDIMAVEAVRQKLASGWVGAEIQPPAIKLELNKSSGEAGKSK